MLSAEERSRYARQLSLPGFGAQGQERLREGRVLVVGCGGLGSAALAYLAAAGVGRIGFVDSDLVEVSNLQRQVLHSTADIGRLKTASAEGRLRALNPHVHLEGYSLRLSTDNARAVFAPYDIVVDACDNYATKFLINDVCCAMRKPFVHAGLGGWCGQLLTVVPGRSACLRCVAPGEDDAAAEEGEEPTAGGVRSGPMGMVPGVLGALEAGEAIKYLTGQGELMTGRLLLYDALAGTFETIRAAPAAECRSCAHLFAGAEKNQKERRQ